MRAGSRGGPLVRLGPHRRNRVVATTQVPQPVARTSIRHEDDGRAATGAPHLTSLVIWSRQARTGSPAHGELPAAREQGQAVVDRKVDQRRDEERLDGVELRLVDDL